LLLNQSGVTNSYS